MCDYDCDPDAIGSSATIKCDYETHSKFLSNRLLSALVSISPRSLTLDLPYEYLAEWQHLNRIHNKMLFGTIDGITSWISSLQLHLSLFHYIATVCGLRTGSYEFPIYIVSTAIGWRPDYAPLSLSQSAHISFEKSFVFGRAVRIWNVPAGRDHTPPPLLPHFTPSLQSQNKCCYLRMQPSTWNNNKTVSLFTVAVNRNEIFCPAVRRSCVCASHT